MKTLYIAAAKAVPKDPSKIDSTYRASQLIDQAQGDEDIQAGIIEAQKQRKWWTSRSLSQHSLNPQLCT